MITNVLAIAASGAIFCLSISSTTARAADPAIISNSDLTKLPFVHSVTFAQKAATERQIIHILDWHFVSQADFAADVRDQSVAPISNAEIGSLYEEFLADVEAIQQG